MLKQIILTASILLSSASFAEPLVVKPGEVPVNGIASFCAQGCIILNPSDLEHLQERVQEALQGAFNQGAGVGYQQGAKDALEALKSNPKLCPRNI